ncbi:recombinase family protein [Xylophilus sp. ASV27]|uniref:recombinase family protein n=1 Tax=Xylophilus sp. ASV27 TaxID=2795129 RepID=UPI0018ED6EA3|nr:recombinase family protein [Xylophilus sp. ASV27]
MRDQEIGNEPSQDVLKDRDKPREPGRTLGYARVSTEEQNLDLQIRALKGAGCQAIYTDHVSGKTESRPGLNEALATLQKGDKLVVWRLDRLGRSLVHLVQMLELLGARQIKFCSLCEHIDTASSGGRLVFHMMAALAEFERCLISERTRAGMAAAKSRGKRMGRHPSMDEEQQGRALRLIEQGGSVASVARQFDVTPRTVYRMLRRMRPAVAPGAACGH